MGISNITVKLEVSRCMRIWMHCMEARVLRGGIPPTKYEIDRAIEKWMTLK